MSEGKSVWDGADLRTIARELSGGARVLDRVTSRDIPPVDAGASSALVADALGRLQKVTTVIAQHLSTTADKVDAANGAFGQIETTNEDGMRAKMNDLYPEPSARPWQDQPLEWAPREDSSQDDDKPINPPR